MKLGSTLSLLAAGAVIGFVAGRLTATREREVIVQEPEIVWYVAPQASLVPTPRVSIHEPTQKPRKTPRATSTSTPASVGGAELVLPAPEATPALARVKQIVGDDPMLRVEFAGEIPRYRVWRARSPNRLYVDFEGTSVPGGDTGPRAGAAPIRELRARVVTNAGGLSIARVEVLLDEEEGALPEVFREEDAGAVVLRW